MWEYYYFLLEVDKELLILIPDRLVADDWLRRSQFSFTTVHQEKPHNIISP